MNVLSDRKTKTISLPDEAASQAFGRSLAKNIASPLVIGFQGELGAGKTTIIRALLQALGIKTTIKSPTFSLVESYSCPGFELHHFDLYRLNDPQELEFMGFRDYFHPESVCCIEWPDKAQNYIEFMDVVVSVSQADEGRRVTLQAWSQQGVTLLKDI